MRTYLSNRFQYVRVANDCLSKHKLACGVPQGSLLGPILYSMAVFSRRRLSRLTFLGVFCLQGPRFFTTPAVSLNIPEGVIFRDLKIIIVFTSKIIFYLGNLKRARP